MEDRRFPRIEIDEPVGVHVGDYYKVEKGRQFSEGGMLFETARDFSVGQKLHLTFQLSDAILIKLEGEVAYTLCPTPDKKAVGVRFLAAQTDHIRILIDYFRRRGTA